MNTRANKPMSLPLLIGGIAVVLASGIALASLAFSAEDFSGPSAAPEPAVAAPAAAAPGANYTRCAECGVIETTREVEVSTDQHGASASGRIAVCKRDAIGGNPERSREIIVRLRDGSRRVIIDAKPARWKHGELVTLIAGMD